MDSDNEDENTNVISKVDQGSMANGDNKLNKVFQAKHDDQYNLSHVDNFSDSSDSNNEQEEKRHLRLIKSLWLIMLTKQTTSSRQILVDVTI